MVGSRDAVVLWQDGAWRCEFHPGSRATDASKFTKVTGSSPQKPSCPDRLRHTVLKFSDSKSVAVTSRDVPTSREASPCPKCGEVLRVTSQDPPMVLGVRALNVIAIPSANQLTKKLTNETALAVIGRDGGCR